MTIDVQYALNAVQKRYALDDASMKEFIAACETMAEIHGRKRIAVRDIKAARILTLDLQALTIVK
jgi:hypothetical protein